MKRLVLRQVVRLKNHSCFAASYKNDTLLHGLGSGFLSFREETLIAKQYIIVATSEQARLPAKFKHINKRRKRN